MTDVKDTRTLEGALKVLNAAIAEATRIGQPMCIAVVDTSGNLLAFARMDGSTCDHRQHGRASGPCER